MTDSAQRIKQKVKSHIPKDWLTEIRISYRIVIETAKGIAQTGLINVAIITTMAAILTIFGALFRSTLAVSTIVGEMGTALEVSAYLKPDANIKETVDEIKKLENVKQVEFISKDKSWHDLKKEIAVPDIDNPLPNTLHVKVDKPKNISKVMTALDSVKGVDDTSYAKDLIKKFELINQISHTVTLFVVILSCILTLVVINNTIELVIQSRKDEIEIMRLMGVNNWYIKTPLVLQGAIYGFLGALISIIPVNIISGYIVQMHNFFMIPINPYSQFFTVASLLFLSIGCAAGGSLMSIKKHLEV